MEGFTYFIHFFSLSLGGETREAFPELHDSVLLYFFVFFQDAFSKRGSESLLKVCPLSLFQEDVYGTKCDVFYGLGWQLEMIVNDDVMQIIEMF